MGVSTAPGATPVWKGGEVTGTITYADGSTQTVATDGYNAVQLGFGAQKTKNVSKAEAAHAKKAGLDSTPRLLNEAANMIQPIAQRKAIEFFVEANHPGYVFRTDRGKLRTVCGVVTEARAGDSDGRLASYQLVIRDMLAVMEKRTNTRVFRNLDMERTIWKNLPKIVFSKTLDKLKGALRKTAAVLNTDVRTLFPAFLSLTLAGVILGLAYQWTGDLSASIGIHAGWIFWLKFYGFATRRAPDVDPWFWGTGKLVDGWLAFAALVVVLSIILLARRRTGT